MTRQRPVELEPGIAWFPTTTPTLPPATQTNSYALGAGEVLLVEPATPYADEQRAWIDWARGLASRGGKLVAIFVTHHHADHVGGAAVLGAELGLELWGHDETAARLPHLAFARRLSDHETITLRGPTTQRWHCLHTPGHAPGHLCLHERDRGICVVGDMVASEGTILIDPYEGNLGCYVKELRRLAELDCALALPAHGAPICPAFHPSDAHAHTPRRLLEHYVRHRLARERKVHAALETTMARHEAPATLDALLPLAYGDTPTAVWPLARLSLEAHLVELERQGSAERCEAGWFRRTGG